MITEADLRGRYDEARSAERVRAALAAIDTADSASILRFLGHYVRWNAGFGAGVAHLAAKIGRAWEQFVDPNEPIPAIADRSLHVASWFFDAARDEFDDSATPHRDAHRSLAQACLKGVILHAGLSDAEARAALAPPEWLLALEQRTWRGYGLGTGDDRLDLAHAMGFHLGSEVLADEEFSMIDQHLRDQRPDLVQALLRRRVEVAGASHPAWYWIGVHSGHGGAVEEAHFDWAVRGVTDALRYTPPEHAEAFRAAVLDGFSAFAACHEVFFRHLSGG